ncbi:hypothetical protein [Thermophilibacter sp.]|uniref:hypothetical protein n=1 Tax=Thermophilibacter sp. TaxID=2847309 RepID=UPI003A8EC9FE
MTGSLYTPGGYIVGGLVGQCTGNSQVIECSPSTDVTVDGLSGPCVGGVVGQWETTGNDSLIADCYFDGSIEIASGTSANGGILGGCFEEKGPTVSNCIVLTTAISQPTFTSFLGVFPKGTSIEHRLWPTGAYIQEGGSAESGRIASLMVSSCPILVRSASTPIPPPSQLKTPLTMHTAQSAATSPISRILRS